MTIGYVNIRANRRGTLLDKSSSVEGDPTAAKKTRIIIADDHPLQRQALRYILEKQPDFEIAAEACDGEEAVMLAMKLMPDVVIMDITMPKLNGLEATRQIKEKCSDINVLVLSVHSDSEHILSILEAGAIGYLTKSAYDSEIIHSIRALALGETVLSPIISKQILKYAFYHIQKPTKLESGDIMTSKELQVLKLVAKGISNKDIASTLGFNLRSVKGYLSDIFLKLNAKTRTQAVIMGLQKGILIRDDIE
jgi:two-component system, NarL family, response regulator LiaR